MCPHTVHAVIAVKTLESAKSRLAGVLTREQRSRLVLAMLADTVRAAGAVPAIASITVVTPDAAVAETARALAARIHPEPAAGGEDGLNTALADAAAALRARYGATGLLALQADLPALRPAELAAVLAAAPTGTRALVADHAGTGTAALLAPAGVALRPRFGRDSAHRHRCDGARELQGHWPGLRRDIDTPDDLAAVSALGPGRDTAALLGEPGWPHHVREAVTQVC